MLIRPLLVALAGSAVLLAGCSSEPTVVTHKPNSSSAASSEQATSEPSSAEQAESASAPLGPEECVEVTGARLDIILATNTEEATPPADILKKCDPPASVLEAIDHFVEVGAIQFDDPDATKYTDELEAWVNEVCPT